MNTAYRNAAREKARYRADCSAFGYTIARHQEQPADNADHIATLVRLAFEKLKAGTTDCSQFDRLASAFNVALIRAESIDQLAEDVMQAGRDALRRCDQIYARHRHYGFTGPDLALVSEAVDLYEQVLRMSTPRQMEEAVFEAAQRMLAAMGEQQS